MAVVTYDQVARACDELRAQGTRPSQRLVMAKTGGGAAQVLQHLRAWNAQHPDAAAPAPALSPALTRLLAEEFGRVEAQARLNAEERLREVEEANEELVRESGRLDQENTVFQQQLADLAAERDRLIGQVTQQQADLEKLQQQLAAERSAAEQARVSLAQANLKAESQKEIADALREETSNLRAAIATERQGRVDAERGLAGAQAARETLEARVAELMARTVTLASERDKALDALNTERTARTDAQRELAASQAEAKAAVSRAADLQQREGQLREELKDARARQSKEDDEPTPRRQK